MLGIIMYTRYSLFIWSPEHDVLKRIGHSIALTDGIQVKVTAHQNMVFAKADGSAIPSWISETLEHEWDYKINYWC